MGEANNRDDEPETFENTVHARIDLYAAPGQPLEVYIEAVNDSSNPAVHFAMWLHKNLKRLGEEAAADFARQNKPRIILDLKGKLRGPDGKPVN